MAWGDLDEEIAEEMTEWRRREQEAGRQLARLEAVEHPMVLDLGARSTRMRRASSPSAPERISARPAPSAPRSPTSRICTP